MLQTGIDIAPLTRQDIGKYAQSATFMQRTLEEIPQLKKDLPALFYTFHKLPVSFALTMLLRATSAIRSATAHRST